jgi:hypothetical protein
MRYAFHLHRPSNLEFCTMGGPITDVPNVSQDCATVRRYIVRPSRRGSDQLGMA